MSKAVQRLIKLNADSGGNPPSSIQLLNAGHWHTPWHGAFEMTPTDLADMVIHFEEGVGLVADSKKAPINYGHDISGKAAGWITSLYLDNNGTELWGNIEWTPEGQRMLGDGEFKYISPEWNPRDLPWEDPEKEGEMVDNVLTGAGLTNIPLFKKLKPVMASATGGGDKSTEGVAMTLEEILAKKAEDLTTEEKDFLKEHKSELTAEQVTAFGLGEEENADAKAKAEADAKAAADAEAAKKAEEEKQKQAAAKPVSIAADRLARLEADAKAGREAQTELTRTRLTASVKEHIARGAIKSDQLDSTVDMLMASSADAQKAQLDFISKLPSNSMIASEAGKATAVEASVEITDEEKKMASAFNVTVEDIKAYKKAKAEGKL